jgi:hypothetical protein
MSAAEQEAAKLAKKAKKDENRKKAQGGDGA